MLNHEVVINEGIKLCNGSNEILRKFFFFDFWFFFEIFLILTYWTNDQAKNICTCSIHHKTDVLRVEMLGEHSITGSQFSWPNFRDLAAAARYPRPIEHTSVFPFLLFRHRSVLKKGTAQIVPFLPFLPWNRTERNGTIERKNRPF